MAGVFKDFGKGLLPSADIIINDYAPYGPMLLYKEQPLNVFGNVQVFVRLTEGCDISSVNDKLNELFKDAESVYGELSLVRSDEFYFSEGNIFLERGKPSSSTT